MSGELDAPTRTLQFGRGILWGSATGISITVGALLVTIAITSGRPELPGWSLVAIALPGAFALGFVFGIPLAALTVWLMVRLQSRYAIFRNPIAWMIGGAVTSGLLGALFDTVMHGVYELSLTLGAIGAIAGLAAGFGVNGLRSAR